MRWLFCLLAIVALVFTAFWVVKRLSKPNVNFVARYSIAAHPYPVVSMTFSPDGRLLVTRDRGDRTVKVWKVKDGQLVYNIAVTPAQPISFAFSPDAKFLAIAYADGSIRIFKSQNGQLMRTLQVGKQAAWQGQVLFSPDGKFLAQTWIEPSLIIGKNEVLIWRVSDGNLVRRLKFGDWIHGFAFSPDGKFLAVVSCAIRHLEVTLWDTSKWIKRSLLFAGGQYPCIFNPKETIKFLSSQDKLAVALSEAKTLFILNLKRKTIERSFCAATLPYSIDPYSDIAWHPKLSCDVQGQLVAIAEIEGISVLFHRLSERFSRLPFRWAHNLSLWLDQLAMENLSRAVPVLNLYRLSEGRKVARLMSDGWISDVAISPNGRYLAIGHNSGKVVMWERKNR